MKPELIAGKGTMIEIRHRWSDAVLWSGDVQTIHEAVKAALIAGADLRDANLAVANLAGAVTR